MCGICGIIQLTNQGISLNKLQAMNDVAIHRGPDDKGFAVFTSSGELYVASHVSAIDLSKKYSLGLAHRRLSIIDLSQRAHQPMFDQSRRYCIVYNGELYNYKELRAELKSLGIRFYSDSDTEVILAAYMKWGTECLNKFNGMWAFAIYDRKENILFCCRDHFGIKPFYYMCDNNNFVFSSEIKQISECFSDSMGINEKILADFLLWGYETHTEETFFANVISLPQGHYLLINCDNINKKEISPEKYWQHEQSQDSSDTLNIDIFREQFIDSVNIRLRSDVPVGITLSGGLDSSSIACAMADILGESNGMSKPNMFTVDYPDPGLSEREYANAVSAKTGFNHYYINPDAGDLIKDWNKFIWHVEEPFGSLSYYSSWKVYEYCREKNTPVILIGQGGDELLLGYDRYRSSYFNILLRTGKLKKAIHEFLQNKKNADMSFFKQILYQIYFTFPIAKRTKVSFTVRPYLKKEFYDAYKNDTYMLTDEMSNKSLSELQLKEFFKYQLQHLLRHDDRLSMAFSIESRLPFLDYRLFNFVLGLKDSLKLNAGWSKYILREAMDGYLPDLIKNRTDKKGYETPTKRLFVNNKDAFLKLLLRNKNDKYINVDNSITGINNNRIDENLLCRIITYFAWKEAFNL